MIVNNTILNYQGSLMKNTLFTLLFFLASFTQLEARSSQNHEMKRTCNNKAVRNYNLRRENIKLATPRYNNGRTTIYGQSPKNRKNALFFACNFDRKGRFLNIKVEKDLRRNNNKVSKAAKRACKKRASRVWRVSKRNVSITHTQRIKNRRYSLTMKTRNRTARCEVNAQGNIRSFHTKRAPKRGNAKAKSSCKRTASRLWRVPTSHIRIDRTRKVTRDRYHMTLRYGRVNGRCDVSRRGHIYHFRTHH